MHGNPPDEKSGWRTANDRPAPSIEEVERLLSPWLHSRRVVDVQLLAGGLMNRNCRVQIEGAREPVVLRLYDRSSASCAKELAVIELVRRDVPVPAVLHAEPDGRDGGPACLVMEFVPGISLRELKLAGDRRPIDEAAYHAGVLLARLKAHTFPSVGLLTSSLEIDSSFLAGPVTTTSLVELFARDATFQRRVAAALRDRLLDAARAFDAAHDAPAGGASLVHGDFNSRNILVREERGRWRVAAVLDWEFAFAASPLCDAGNLLRYERTARPVFEPSFSQGCRDGGLTLDGDWRYAARMADLPALCELLTREYVPAEVVAELIELVTATIERRDPQW